MISLMVETYFFVNMNNSQKKSSSLRIRSFTLIMSSLSEYSVLLELINVLIKMFGDLLSSVLSVDVAVR